jgi:hypothetical protein
MDQAIASASLEVEQLLEFVNTRREELAGISFEPRKPRPYLGADRWLLASLVQKSIRRSDIDTARRAGHQLLFLDPARLWRRLMVVGLEDIGIADVNAASFLIGLAALPRARALWGSPTCVLDAALHIACDANKERSGDAFGSIVKEMEQESGHSLEGLPRTAKLAVLSYGYLPWRRRLRAAFLLGREWVPAEERKAQFIEMAEIFRAAGVPELLLSACLLYRGKSDDLLPLYVPVAYSLWLGHGGVRCISNASCAAPLIDAVPAYGFDPLHTRLGRRAIDVWMKSYITTPPFSASQVAIAQWNMESAACRRIMNWQLSDEIRAHGQAADLLHRGLSPDRHEEITDWVCAQQPILQQARSAVWEIARAADQYRACDSVLERKGNGNDE